MRADKREINCMLRSSPAYSAAKITSLICFQRSRHACRHSLHSHSANVAVAPSRSIRHLSLRRSYAFPLTTDTHTVGIIQNWTRRFIVVHGKLMRYSGTARILDMNKIACSTTWNTYMYIHNTLCINMNRVVRFGYIFAWTLVKIFILC
jgi:hypothetical protein